LTLILEPRLSKDLKIEDRNSSVPLHSVIRVND
jgi:hypothetical protein